MKPIKYSPEVRQLMRAGGMTDAEITTDEVRTEQNRRARRDPNHPANQPFEGDPERFMEPMFDPPSEGH